MKTRSFTNIHEAIDFLNKRRAMGLEAGFLKAPYASTLMHYRISVIEYEQTEQEVIEESNLREFFKGLFQ